MMVRMHNTWVARIANLPTTWAILGRRFLVQRDVHGTETVATRKLFVERSVGRAERSEQVRASNFINT